MAKKKPEVDFQVFAKGSEEEFGAVREVGDNDMVVYIEDSGDVAIPQSAIVEVVEGKVIVDLARLSPEVRDAIARAHRDEDYP